MLKIKLCSVKNIQTVQRYVFFLIYAKYCLFFNYICRVVIDKLLAVPFIHYYIYR